MNKNLHNYTAALNRINRSLEKNTIAIEDIEAAIDSVAGYITYLENKVTQLSPKAKAKDKTPKSSLRTRNTGKISKTKTAKKAKSSK